MSKPTIVQSLLNQPSKTYRTTENGKKDYYSTRQEMLRIAADAHETTDDDDDDDDSDDLDVFFTPNQSPRTSMASSAATLRRPSRRSLNADNLVPEPAPSLPVAVPSTRTPATTPTTRANHALSNASLTSTTLDAHSIYSSADSTWNQPKPIGPPVRTNSNGSPANPPSPKLPSPRQPHTFSAFASIATTTTSSMTPPAPAAKTRPATQNTPKPRIPPPPASAPPPKPTMAAGPTKAPAQRRPPPTVITTTTTNPKPHPQPARRHPSPPSPSPSPPPTTRKKPTPVKPPGSMLSALGGSGMGALLEEDEDGPLTPRMASRALGSDLSDSDTPPPGWDANLYPTPRSLRHTSRSSASTSNPYSNNASPPVRRRRSRSRSPDPDRSSSSSSTTTASRPHSHSTINGNGSSTTRAPKTLSAEVHALVSTFVSTGELPSNGTPGYTSLVLPRAPPPNPTTTPANPMTFNPLNVSSGGASDKVDLTLTGLAQRTMASVEITRGLGSRAGTGMFSKLGLNLKRSSTTPSYVPRGPSDPLSKPSFATTASPLSFTAYRAPPTHVPSGSVLVQVWAVGLDAVDARLVGVGFRRGPEIGVDQFSEGNVRSNSNFNANGNMNGHAHPLAEPPAHNHPTADDQPTEDNDNDQEADEEDIEDLNTTPSTSSTTSPPRKNAFASLGRSLSFRLSRSSPSKPGNARNNANFNSNSKSNSNSSNPNVNGKGSPSKPSVRPPSASVTFSNTTSTPTPGRPDISRPKRSFSLKRNNTDGGNTSTTQSWAGSGSGTPSKSKSKPQTPGSTPSASPAKLSKSPPHMNSKANETLKKKDKEKPRPVPLPTTAQVGYIPGRSFVGRVVHCGWDVGEEAAKKGDWVVGLLDVRKAGALTEFIVVDRHRVHRVPHPRNADARGSSSNGNGTAQPTSANGYANGYTNGYTNNINGSSGSLTLEQLALLPLTGLAAYRAVRTFVFAFAPASHAAPGPGSNTYPPPSTPSTTTNGPGSALKSHPEHPPPPLPRRRALVLLGHTSTGALATQLLISRGWRVSLQAPFSAVGAHTPQSASTSFMAEVEARARAWGADEVIFDDGEEGGMDGGRGAVVRVLEAVRDDGDIFDGVLDTLGGKEVWVAAERLLSLQGPGGGGGGGEGGVVRRGSGQFTTVVGHYPERVVPSARDNWKAGLRALRMGSGSGAAGASAGAEESNSSHSNVKGQGKVGYAWVSVAQDVDWEGEDVSETLGKVVRLALEEGIVPVVEGVGVDGKNQSRVWSFEQAPMAFVDNGPLVDGGTIVVRIA